MTTLKKDVYQDITNKLIAKIEEGGFAAWRKSWQGMTSLPTRSTGEHYKGINLFILGMAGRKNPNWFTYNQAKQLKAQVKKGEKGTTIVFYKPLKITDKISEKEKTIPMLKTHTVFNAEQIDGLAEKWFPTFDAKHFEPRIAEAETFLDNSGARISHGGAKAFYRPSTDQIVLPEYDQFNNAVSYYGTALHELIHWTGSEKRCDRNLKNSFGTKDYAREELVAEIGATFICATLNLEQEIREDHVAYLSVWLEVLKGDKKAIFKAASLAQKAIDHLEGLQTKMAIAA